MAGGGAAGQMQDDKGVAGTSRAKIMSVKTRLQQLERKSSVQIPMSGLVIYAGPDEKVVVSPDERRPVLIVRMSSLAEARAFH
jgi:hypothetical protein